jgi:hypothetical protein
MEKEIWKWILETFTDEGIANIALTFGIRIPGFRQINPQQKNFKIVRQRIIQEALHQRNAQNLANFFQLAAENKPELVSLKGKSIDEQLQAIEEEIYPSILLGVLLSSNDVADQSRAQEIYIKLKDEDKLDLLEKIGEEKFSEKNDEEQEETFAQLQILLNSAHQKIEKLEKKLNKFEQKNEELKNQEALAQAKLKNERKQWKEEKKEFIQENNFLKGEQGALKHIANSVTSEKDSLQKKLKKLAESLKKKEDEISSLHARVLKLTTELEKEKAQQSDNPIENRLQDYGDKKPAFMLEAVKEIAATSTLLMEKPVQRNRTEMTEDELMKEFIQTTREQGLLYDEMDLYNFHTAMKSSNLVILAGMSGTGKSKLVQAYGEALGLYDDYQMTFIPVRPSWTDDADLIGYADTLNCVYRPGDSGVINALLSAEQNKNKLHIICFDEMNLARVEHYFSQFLSVLELDSGPSKVLQLYNEDLKDRLNNSAAYPPIIPIGENVIFIGTVNLDESTYHFSDKLLDRANVITLNVLSFESLKVLTQEVRRKPVEKANGTISFELFNSYRNRNRDIHMLDRELELLWEIHTELQKVNKNLGAGPRIVRQIDIYLKNLPKTSHFTRKEAFDKQVVQRILTKVRGPEDQLKKFIGLYDKQTENIEESKLGDILDKYQEVSEFYETRNVLIHKAKELKFNGYTL